MKEIVKVQCIKHKYPDKTEVAVCGMDFVVNAGEKVALIGANGSGKTTLLLHIMGLLEPTEGKVEIFSVNPVKKFKEIGEKMGIAVQDVEDQLIGPTVFDDIAFSLINYGYSKEEIEKRVEDIIQELKIKKLKDRIVHYLSGGEKKKVAIASALVLKPKLLILDEALAELDTQTEELIIKMLDRYSREYQTGIIMATNDIDLVKRYADIVYLLDKGKIIFKGTYDELLKSGIECEVCVH